MAQTTPIIPAQQSIIEFNLNTIILAIILAVILTAANAYIGLLVGMTVSASIPAAALSMAIMSWFKNTNILQNNMVQTSASAGEALAAGVIFTVPALVLMQAWQGYSFWPILILALSGGLLGVIFTIPLRRALIINRSLAFPEGVATAEVLQAGFQLTGTQANPTELNNSTHYKQTEFSSKSQLGVRHLLQACGISALFKLIGTGFGIFSASATWIKPLLNGQILANFSIQFSPALLGVGYIVGINIAILVLMGGLIGSLIGIPLNWYLQSDFWLEQVQVADTNLLTQTDWQQLANMIWQDNRRLGVGAMLVGGLWSLIQIAKPVWVSIKTNLKSFQSFKQTDNQILRTEHDLPFALLILAMPIVIAPLVFLIYPLLGGTPYPVMFTLIWTLFVVVFAFIFSSVAAYMAGVVGSSNNPISGVTIATVLVSSVIWFYLLSGLTQVAQIGGIIVMYLAAVTCSAAAISGDNLQDLKCGHILGSTPWKQQVFQMIGVVVAAIVLPFILILLDTSYGIGRASEANPNADFLAAPQAVLMRDLTTGIFNQSLDWLMIQLGALIAFIIIIVDSILARFKAKFRLHVLAVAIGIYLPLALAISLFIGALLRFWLESKLKHRTESEKAAHNKNGLLLASGLITGEALMGVLLAVFAAFVIPLATPIEYASWTGVIAFFLICLYIYKRSRAD
ncbi:OPT family oligopeptide transporter [Catenovulum adriaticum]|uniref:Oligopeptide transporter, OPT family n=1 Tax=Catenovulum adriaticum TaxID=2984846 RepID=A0ABY7AIH2_9ALTE|nr:oligopeptide transporter, OPT family [Catenovulum sp. TS8]WAJ69403.1 oligopeptide transporter, OPT family [Catenovulum sp. TS8]